ncbi:MAG TPA: penicillin-binding transpeptidase domain-containing protein [Wenzhouxiangella sp.]|nr:penicillin-binding transpeptidase domain-containing protein [Wenzhouxiangella sp.]
MTDQRPRNVSVLRVWLTAGIMLLGVVVLVARAVNLQVTDTEFLQSQGEARYLRTVDIPTVRGSILDRHGEPLAVSTPVDSVWAHPGELLQAVDRLPELADVLNMRVDVLERRLTQRANREFVWLRRRVHPELAEQVKDLDVPGVSLQAEYRRFYPTAEVTAQVLGFTNVDDAGQEGLELAYNAWLQGEPGSKRVIKDRLGRVVQDIDLIREARPGRDLQLTLDRRLQYLSFRALKQGIQRVGARSGSVVVMDVTNGEIVAMVNYPSYNPNNSMRAVGEGIRNRAMTDVLEPGSVIKPFAVAAAMEAGLATPDMPIDTTPGTLTVSGHTIRDVRDFGLTTVEGLLVKSSNVGVVQLVLSMEARHLWGLYSRLGFGVVTGTGFPGESAGVLRDFERWRKLEQATLAYGYGLSVTPLQLVRAMAALADGGRLHQPTFIVGSDNPVQSVMDPALAQEVVAMLEKATGVEGTGQLARVPGYRVAGKTGTTRLVGAGGYESRYVSSFGGLAPASRPRMAAVVVINDPTGDQYYGGQVAAPVFGEVMSAALRLFSVPPDDLSTLMAAAGEEG